LLIAIDPLINPFRTLTIVGTSITVSSFISEQTTDEQGIFEGNQSRSTFLIKLNLFF
jgi:hypothetical protein